MNSKSVNVFIFFKYHNLFSNAWKNNNKKIIKPDKLKM